MQLLQPSSGNVLWEGKVEGAVAGTSRLIASTHWDDCDYANEALKIAVSRAWLKSSDACVSSRQ
jgi:hypothetical protein